jgi:hypothetical protein
MNEKIHLEMENEMERRKKKTQEIRENRVLEVIWKEGGEKEDAVDITINTKSCLNDFGEGFSDEEDWKEDDDLDNEISKEMIYK